MALTGTKCRVLVADDVEDIRLLTRILLERDGRFEVVGEAGDGAEAVRLAGLLQPDAVVLDISMPVMDGLEAAPRIRHDAPGCMVVVLSAFTDAKYRDSALAAGASAFVDKRRFDDVISVLAPVPAPT